MIRVTFEEGPPLDVEANHCQAGPYGELNLNHAETEQTVDPNTFRPVTILKSLEWRMTISRDSRWRAAKPLEEEATLEAVGNAG